MQARLRCLILALLLAALPAGAAADAPPQIAVRSQFWAAGLPVAAPFEIVQVVADFPPGSWTGQHTHAGQVVTTVLAGEIVQEAGGKATRYTVGESWSESPDDGPHRTGNPGTAPATMLATYLLPKGADTSDAHPGGPQPDPPGPTDRHRFRTDGLPLPASFEVVQLVTDFQPGAAMPAHRPGGQATKTILAGKITRRTGSAETPYTPGESWLETPTDPSQAAINTTTGMTTVLATYLVPKGGPVLIRTPDLPAPDAGKAQPAPYRGLAPLLVGVLLAGVGLARRRAIRRSCPPATGIADNDHLIETRHGLEESDAS
jgi:quercetin dioxygenase-like cupin family protein